MENDLEQSIVSNGQNTKTLCEVGNGESVRVESLLGETSECQRLREMGFCETAEIEKISGSGALICKVCNAKIVISNELAKNVIVGENTPESREYDV